MLELTIYQADDGLESLQEEGALWRLVSFSYKHVCFEHPDTFYRDYHGKVPNSKLARKFNSDMAFLLDYYEHGNAYWSMHGEGTQCRWDTAQRAGLLLANYPPREMQAMGFPKHKREESARNYLSYYNDCVNGFVFTYTIQEYRYCSKCSQEEYTDHPTHSGSWYGSDLRNMYQDIRSALELYKGQKVNRFHSSVTGAETPEELKDLIDLEKEAKYVNHNFND
jgi:hypothetical protein